MTRRRFIHGLFLDNGGVRLALPDYIRREDLPADVLSQLGTQGPPGPPGPGLPSAWVDGSANGIKGDGTYCYPAFQSLVNSVPAGTEIILPNGTINIGSGNCLELMDWIGGQFHLRSIGGTVISGNIDGSLVSVNKDAQNVTRGGSIYNVEFFNGSASPLARSLRMEQVADVQLVHCRFKGNYGLCIGQILPTNVNVSIYDAYFDGDLSSFPLGIGGAVRGQGIIGGFTFLRQWHKGLMLAQQWHLDRVRAEVNDTAVVTGVGPDGTPAPAIVTCNNFSSEANLTTLDIEGGRSEWALIDIDGHPRHAPVDPSPSGTRPDYGVRVEKNGVHSFRNLIVGGEFTVAGIRVNSSLIGKSARFHDSSSTISNSAPGLAWDVSDGSNGIFSNTNSGFG